MKDKTKSSIIFDIFIILITVYVGLDFMFLLFSNWIPDLRDFARSFNIPLQQGIYGVLNLYNKFF